MASSSTYSGGTATTVPPRRMPGSTVTEPGPTAPDTAELRAGEADYDAIRAGDGPAASGQAVRSGLVSADEGGGTQA